MPKRPTRKPLGGPLPDADEETRRRSEPDTDGALTLWKRHAPRGAETILEAGDDTDQ